MPTLRLLIHSVFCENSSSSSSCDRGKTKSTNSHKTKPEVWQQFWFSPLNLDLECGTPSSACFHSKINQYYQNNDIQCWPKKKHHTKRLFLGSKIFLKHIFLFQLLEDGILLADAFGISWFAWVVFAEEFFYCGKQYLLVNILALLFSVSGGSESNSKSSWVLGGWLGNSVV